MAENKIITFANQKGGVGKSTLCTLFANYLGAKGSDVLVLDGDQQRSICHRREQEMLVFPEYEWLYNVQGFSLENNENVERLMVNLRRIDGVILVDAPGNLVQPGLTALLTLSDYIVIPLQYEASVMTSTAEFLRWIEEHQANNGCQSKLIFLPNRFKPYCGTRAEKEQIEETDAALQQIGVLCPKIGDHKDIERCQTTGVYKIQQQYVEEAFDFIYNSIFNS